MLCVQAHHDVKHARLFGRELPGLDHVGHQAVVARELLELALVQQVGPRVAHLGDDEPFALQHGSGHGGAHALAAPPLVGSDDDGAVRLLHGASQRLGVGMRGRALGQHVHGDFRSHLAGCVPAHAVGDGEQGGCHHEAVLVVVAQAADVRAAPERGGGALARVWRGLVRALGGHQANLTRMATSPTLTTSPFLSATGSPMTWPFTAVPFVDPRSSTNRFCPMREKRAWRPDT